MSTALEPVVPHTVSRSSSGVKHRPEIDGLRALAILPILLHHCGVTALRGGFTGVDIFFVISGYLITGIIQAELAAGSFSLTSFYRRRIVRILPALTLMIVVVLALGCMILLPKPLRDLGRSAAATAAFGSNIYFYTTVDYFYSDLKPLVHTWSLAVEEQFYLLYPILLLALRGLERRRLVQVLMGISATSILTGLYYAVFDPGGGFYLLPARIWELLLGGLVALGVFPKLPQVVRTVAVWGALVVIVASVFAIKSTWPFPVPFAFPVAGSAALLIAYAPGTRAAGLLSLRPLRWIGLISYSLYIWHRPIIAFYLQGRSEIIGSADIAIVVTLSFMAAILSYFLVERPALRRWRKGTGLMPHMIALGGLVAIAAAGLIIAKQAERIKHLPPDVTRVASYLQFDKTPAGRAQYATGHCFHLPYTTPNDTACLQMASDRANVLLVGDSHAGQLSQELRRAIAPANMLQATAAGCRPTIQGKGLRSCRGIVIAALEEVDVSRLQGVVIAGRWFDTDRPLLVETVRRLQQRGARRIVVVGPMVEYSADFPDLLARSMLDHDFGRMEKAREADRRPLDEAMRQDVIATGARYVSHFDIECPGGRCRLFTADGGPIHIDRSHLTPLASIPVAQAIAREISR